MLLIFLTNTQKHCSKVKYYIKEVNKEVGLYKGKAK